MCGYQPARVLLEMLPERTEIDLLKYDTSGRQTDDYSSCVSYLAVSFSGGQWPIVEATPLVEEESTPVVVLNAQQRHQALVLSRKVLERAVACGQTVDSAASEGIELDAVFQREFAVFVTLKKDGKLRGCIGNIRPVGTLENAIITRTVSASLHDRRFRPVGAAELDDIDIEISVLTLPRKVDSHRDIVTGRHGVILQKNGRRAVFLPQVAPEQGWSVDETLSQLSRKAGLPADAWRDGATLEVFEAQVFGEAHE
jgi:AmmeMemoRadiSam system protein A